MRGSLRLVLALGLAMLLGTGCVTRTTGSGTVEPPSGSGAAPLTLKTAPVTPQPLPDSGYKAVYLLAGKAPAAMKAGAPVRLTIRVTNAGSSLFPMRPVKANGVGAVYLSYHIFTAGSAGAPETATLWEGSRTPLAADLLPGASVELPITVTAPGKPGQYDLHVDLVHEGISWFSSKGNPELIVPLRVQ